MKHIKKYKDQETDKDRIFYRWLFLNDVEFHSGLNIISGDLIKIVDDLDSYDIIYQIYIAPSIREDEFCIVIDSDNLEGFDIGTYPYYFTETSRFELIHSSMEEISKDEFDLRLSAKKYNL